MKNKRDANFNGWKLSLRKEWRVTGGKCYDFDGSCVMAARPSDKGTYEIR
jgi:hypothetical protein